MRSAMLRRLLGVALAVMLSATAAWAQAAIDPDLTSALAKLPAGGRAEVVVTFFGNRAPDASNLASLEAAGIRGGYTLERLPIVATLATAAQVDALARDPGVRSIYHNKPLTFYNFDATQLTGARRVHADSRMKTLNGGRAVTGRGVTVLVIDSGIDGLHPDVKFGENLIQNAFSPAGRYQDDTEIDLGFRPFPVTENVANTDIASGHGTHVAGTVAGTGAASGGRHAGVAPEANLIGYGSGAVIVLMDALGGLDYALAKRDRYNIRVVTNSWGVQRAFSPDDPIVMASRLLHDAGIVVLFAAGNSGPGPDTQNPYARAPWVISVAAGNKNGTLATFSSRGTPGGPKTSTSRTGETITWLDEPTVTAPGVNIISASASTDVLGTKQDAYYSMMSGTSMATPHAAGIVALMLDANPLLTPAEVKQILKETATRMPQALPGTAYRTFEVGAGYVNAYAAVQKALELGTPFGATHKVQPVLGVASSTVLMERAFDYSPASLPGTYKYTFTVPQETDRVEMEIRYSGLEVLGKNLGNPLLLDVRDPAGNRYTAFDLYFAIYGTVKLTVPVNRPMAGTWTAEVKAFTPRGNETGNFATFPDRVHEKVTAYVFDTPAISDIQGHAANAAIRYALSNGFLGLCGTGKFCPDASIRRADFAKAFTQFGAVRQFLPFGGGSTFSDVAAADRPFVEAAAAPGAALRDREFRYGGVIEGSGGTFNPNGGITRAQVAKMLVRGVGGDAAALAHTGNVTIAHDGKSYVLADQDQIPAELRGYVHAAINGSMLNVFWTVEQGPYDAEPTLKAYFKPTSALTRADAAVAISRYYTQFFR